MPLSIIKETIELDQITLDADGNAFLQKRINLKETMQHNLIQTDLFEDAYFRLDGQEVKMEFAVSPYPVIPTDMPFTTAAAGFLNRYPSAGDDSILFKAIGDVQDLAPTTLEQFPSVQIAANQFTAFYTDHLYINVHVMGPPNVSFANFAWSFMFTVFDKKVPILTHTMGVLKESHDAMCALLMSNGHMISKAALRGNTFPMWRYGGIVGEHMVNPTAAGGFFLEISTLDEELMQTTAQVRSAIADARTMTAFDQPQGGRFPEWILQGLNQGLVSGPVRDQWPPIKHADNGNVRML